MNAKHAYAATASALSAGVLAVLAGVIPEVAGLALLAVAKLAATVSGLAAAGHAHLAHQARDPKDRLIWGTLALLALAVFIAALVRSWSAFDAALRVLLILALPVLAGVILLGRHLEAHA